VQGHISPRTWIAGLVAALVLAIGTEVPARQGSGLPFAFTNVARQAGLDGVTVYGGREKNRYLLETTGSGVALIDSDGDGWLDVFVVNGSTLEGPTTPAPTARLYRNRRDGTFEDITDRAGLRQSGWGQAACVGDYDADGRDDLLVTYWGQNRLFRNRPDGTFVDATAAAGLTTQRRWGSGCAFLDYDRDGHLDLFVANYIDFDPATTLGPESGLCRYKGLPVACGPPGLPGGTNALYRNRGDGTFTDASLPSSVTRAQGTYALGVSTLDFDADGWTDIYVANDSKPSTLYRNQRDGTFVDIGIEAGCAFSQDGRAQAGMGIALADFDRSGTVDIFRTNFAGDTSTLYSNTGRDCEDRTFAAGIGVNTRWLGWGVGALDLERDGWPDLFLVNGHVYPEVAALAGEAPYAQRKVVYRNRGNGRFEDITDKLGAPVTTAAASRGAAFGDIDNDGDVDVVVNNMHAPPDLFRLDVDPGAGHWLSVKLVGTSSHRNAIGARVAVSVPGRTFVDEVRGGGSYYSQNDLRLHFGLGAATAVARVTVRWPKGSEETFAVSGVDRLVTLTEGRGTASAPATR